MKKFIKIICIISIVCIITVGLTACKADNDNYTLVAPDGAPALAVMNLFGKDFAGAKIDISLTAATNIASSATEHDLAILPSNVAVNLFNGGRDIKMIGVVTFGNIYMISSLNNKVESLENLKGKLVYSIGQNSVPDFVFRSVLKNNDIDFEVGESAVEGKVVIKYAQAPAIVQYLMQNKANGVEAYGIIAEPAVTNAVNKGLTQVFDLQELYNNDGESYGYAQAVLIASPKAYNDRDFIKALVKQLANNEKYLLENYSEGYNNIKEKYPSTTLPEAMGETTVSKSNVGFMSAKDAKESFIKLMNDILEINPTIIRNALPTDNFYY